MSQKPTPPKPPADLGTTGSALWRRLVSVYTFLPHEQAILELACHQLDDVAALEALLRADGLIVKGSNGQPRLSAVVSEVRQGRLALAKVLGQLAIPDEEARPASEASNRARKAAEARWGRVRNVDTERKARRGPA